MRDIYFSNDRTAAGPLFEWPLDCEACINDRTPRAVQTTTPLLWHLVESTTAVPTNASAIAQPVTAAYPLETRVWTPLQRFQTPFKQPWGPIDAKSRRRFPASICCGRLNSQICQASSVPYTKNDKIIDKQTSIHHTHIMRMTHSPEYKLEINANSHKITTPKRECQKTGIPKT